MSRFWVSAKLHGIRVTGASVCYHGSVTVGENLLRAAGIERYEQVQVVDLNTGHRWLTYVLPGEDGVFTLNGGGARLGTTGDECVLLTYCMATDYQPATVVFCDENNAVAEVMRYD